MPNYRWQGAPWCRCWCLGSFARWSENEIFHEFRQAEGSIKPRSTIWSVRPLIFNYVQNMGVHAIETVYIYTIAAISICPPKESTFSLVCYDYEWSIWVWSGFDFNRGGPWLRNYISYVKLNQFSIGKRREWDPEGTISSRNNDFGEVFKSRPGNEAHKFW